MAPGDTIDTAIPLTISDPAQPWTSTLYDISQYTAEYDHPRDLGFGRSIWFSYLPDQTMSLRIDTSPSYESTPGDHNVDTMLYVIDSTGDAFVEDDDDGPGYTSALTALLRAGQQYHIYIGCYDEEQTGFYGLQIAPATPGTGPLDAASASVDASMAMTFGGTPITAPPMTVDTHVSNRPDATTKRNTAQGGVIGQTVTVANSGGASGSRLSDVYHFEYANFTYATIGGPPADICFHTEIFNTGHSSSQAAAVLRLSNDPSFSSGGGLALYLPAYPTADIVLFELPHYAGGPSGPVTARLTAAGNLKLVQFFNEVIATSTSQLPLNTWFRIEWSMNLNMPGSYELIILPDRASTTPVERFHDDTFLWNGPRQNNEVTFGLTPTQGVRSIYDFYFDDIECNDVGQLPSAAVPAPPASQLNAPPMTATVDLDPSGLPPAATALTAPPMTVTAQLGPADLAATSFELLAPAPGVAIPVLRPAFTVAVTLVGAQPGSADTATVDIQHATDAAFTTPSTLSQTVEVFDGTFQTTMAAADPLAPGGYFWRARLTHPTVTATWTPASTFTVNPASGDLDVAVTWSVDVAAPTLPHLWFVQRDVGEPGDVVTVLGNGFGPDPTVTLSEVDMPIQQLRRMPGTPAAATADRTITRETVDPEHDEIDVMVPDVAAPGGPLQVFR